ncbi:MAG: hypothetical protein ACQGVC_10010 [Myxococcota bacterium]
MKRRGPVSVALLLCVLFAAAPSAADSWPAYLDYAYVYSSAEPDALRARLAQYGNDAGIQLRDYAAKEFGPGALVDDEDETRIRRAAIAQLLIYLSTGEPEALDESVDTIRRLEDRLSRHENRYWYHYILAQRALETGQRFDFVGELLDLWLHVIVPLETPYATLQTLSLGDSTNSGFVSALPYLFENVARLILIRSQEMGLDRDLDPLGAVVRMLYDGRVGAHPDVIPVELSSREYLERIVTRLDGPESDVGSLTFTLALFEASKFHDRARGLLASQGLSDETVKALRVSAGAYETALNRAETLQGQATVYSRVLRQLGEVYAAKQRLGVDPDIQASFSIEGAIEVFTKLAREGAYEEDGIEGWQTLGFERREAWVATLHHLWEEIQEVSLNAADYYLTRAVEQRHLADDHARSAARIHARYLSFFHKNVTSKHRALVPDSAYFAGYEAARGYGDAMLAYTTGNLSHAEMKHATQRYLSALKLFPFDRKLWHGLTAALERQGRESEYLDLARPVAEAVTGSRHVDAWIEAGEPGAQTLAVLRRALADSQVLVYLGFAEESGVAELAASLDELKARRDEVEQRLAALVARRESIGRTDGPGSSPPAAIDDASAPTVDGIAALRLGDLSREIADAKRLLGTLEKQIEARTRALPLYQATLGTDGLADELRARRDHPMHTLLRRMYHEQRSGRAR